MCGFAALMGTGAAVPGLVEAMGEALSHRGPDGSGVWRSHEQGVALAHRRLSVIELSDAGAQPMVSANGRWVLAFNGEIYNHAALRRSIEASTGHFWRGNSDTETLIEAIALWGVGAALHRCNGMFALAAFDRCTKTLVLARDRFGEKPLYVGSIGSDVVAASELKAFRAHPLWRHSVEPSAVRWLLGFGFIPAPWSIHSGVFKLPAGTLLQIPLSDRPWSADVHAFMSRLERWWDLHEVVRRATQQQLKVGELEAMELVGDALDRAVDLRMEADVPIGALLSGGVDSSLVVSSMVRRSSRTIKTFTVAFDEPKVNEAEFAAETARRLGTDHSTIVLPAGAALASVQHVVDVYDEPFADCAQLAALLVSRAARQSVTVALTGDGGDEAFHGYQRYLDGPRNWRALRRLPRSMREALGSTLGWAAQVLPPGRVTQRLTRQAFRVPAKDSVAYGEALLRFCGSTSFDSTLDPAWRSFPGLSGQLCVGAQFRLVDQGLLLPEGIAHKLDRSSMAVGLELRCPFLDHELIELAWRMPDSFLSDRGRGKSVLRKLASARSLVDVSQRRKQGFDVPMGEWLRGALRDWAETLIRPAMQGHIPFIDAQHISRLWRQHLDRRADFGYGLWAALMYMAWNERHGG